MQSHLHHPFPVWISRILQVFYKLTWRTSTKSACGFSSWWPSHGALGHEATVGHRRVRFAGCTLPCMPALHVGYCGCRVAGCSLVTSRGQSCRCWIIIVDARSKAANQHGQRHSLAMQQSHKHGRRHPESSIAKMWRGTFPKRLEFCRDHLSLITRESAS